MQRQSEFRAWIKDIAISLKAYKIAVQEQEGWQSLVYCNGLENRRAFIGTVGSNPTPSANYYYE